MAVKIAIGAVITGGGENDQRLLLVKLRNSRTTSADPSNDFLIVDIT
jgi:hypothetical protein